MTLEELKSRLDEFIGLVGELRVWEMQGVSAASIHYWATTGDDVVLSFRVSSRDGDWRVTEITPIRLQPLGWAIADPEQCQKCGELFPGGTIGIAGLCPECQGLAPLKWTPARDLRGGQHD